MSASVTRGFVFADLRDYTAFVERHGDAAASALLDRYRVLVRSAVAEYGGAEVKTEGDSFFVVFPSASSAVRCALEILQAATPPRETIRRGRCGSASVCTPARRSRAARATSARR